VDTIDARAAEAVAAAHVAGGDTVHRKVGGLAGVVAAPESDAEKDAEQGGEDACGKSAESVDQG
jgi:hypothetical protein